MESIKKKILICNVVPLNNGDVALFLSLYNQLVKKGYYVKIASVYYKQASKIYPNLPFVKELGDHRIFIKLPFLKPLLLPLLYKFSKAYQEADIIIGAAGGYINSYYNIRNSLSVFKLAKKQGKKTFVYAQSVGPLSSKDITFFENLTSKYIDFILVRDKFSFELMHQMNIPKHKYKMSKDAAFMMEIDKKKRSTNKKVAFSVRAWSFDERNYLAYQDMIINLVQMAVDEGYEIDFVSTCQGIDNYKNDAEVAQLIKDRLNSDYQNKVNVESKYFDYYSLYDRLDDYDFVVGTRLHMCILSLTKLIPAFNISYEIKGKECFDYLELSDYSVDYNERVDIAGAKFFNFIKHQDVIKDHIHTIIPKTHKEAIKDFEDFSKKL